MKRIIFKSILLAAGVVMLQSATWAQHASPSTTYTGVVLPVKNGNINANLRSKTLAKDDVVKNLTAMTGLGSGHSFKQTAEKKDKLGITHTDFQQYYLGVKVEGAQVIVHSKDGLVNSVNGKVAQLGTLSVQPVLKNTEAYTKAKNSTLVTKFFNNYPVELVIAAVAPSAVNKEYALAYKVRIDGRTADRKMVMVNIFVDAVNGKILNTVSLLAHTDVTGTANTFYSGSRSFTIDSVAEGFRLRDNGRKIETYNGGGVETDNQGFFVDDVDYFNTNTNWDLFKMFSATKLQTGSTSLMTGIGSNNILLFGLASGSTPANMALISNPRFLYIFSPSNLPYNSTSFYNILNPTQTYYGAYLNYDFSSDELTDTAVYEITDLNTGVHNWSDVEGNSGTYSISMSKNPALDAHWGMQKTHDYYSTVMSRNSYDDNGSVVKNYVDAGDATNASASPEPYNFMMYGMGDGENMGPVVGLDVMGHEFTHMVTEHNGHGGLDYQGESGALNESFSDIFGTSIEFFTKGDQANWNIGEGILTGNPSFFRSMSNPKLAQNPDTYEGQYWVNPSNFQNDNGGVHTNSGVQNKWYYLLVQGGSGTNDNSDAYTVTGIGMAKAQQIVYRSLTNYLTPQSDYMDAYAGSLQATLDLYGNDTTSQEYLSVKEAWYAVGIGEKPTTAINEIAVSESDLKLYPNPATGRVTIASQLNETLQAQVVNVVGVPVMNITVTKGLNPVDISALAKGIYMIRYNTGSKGYVQKLSVL